MLPGAHTHILLVCRAISVPPLEVLRASACPWNAGFASGRSQPWNNLPCLIFKFCYSCSALSQEAPLPIVLGFLCSFSVESFLSNSTQSFLSGYFISISTFCCFIATPFLFHILICETYSFASYRMPHPDGFQLFYSQWNKCNVKSG